MAARSSRGVRVHLRDHDTKEAVGKVHTSYYYPKQAWENNDDSYQHDSDRRNIEDREAHNLKQIRSQSDNHSVTSEQNMDVDISENTQRDTMSMKNTAELFLKLEALPTLIQNSKQEVMSLRQLLTTKVSDENHQLKEEIERLKRENHALQTRDNKRDLDKMKSQEQELQEARTLLDEYKNAYSKMVQKYKDDNAKVKPLEQQVADHKLKMDKLTDECESLLSELSALQIRNKKISDEKTRMEKELSDSKTRLSRLMGNKLGDNNPDIADLSDKNRPTKLAEKNTELYDNEWTDAFEVFQNHYSTEKQTIEKLLQMLKDIKSGCDKIAKEQEDKLKEAVKLKQSRDSLPDHVFKQLKDFRRFTAEESLHEVMKNCLETVRYKDYYQYLSDEGVRNFFKGCVELCWFMNAQDPPLAFGDTPRRNGQFDSNTFKFYTATGSTYDYMVWPALLLTKGGAILSKGVAQAFKEQTSRNESRMNVKGSPSYVHRSEQQTQENICGYQDRDTTTTHLRHDHNKVSSYHDNTLHSKNYEQSVAGKSENISNKKGFSHTVKERGSVATRMSNNFVSLEREGESDISRKRTVEPKVPTMWTYFKRLSSMYGVNSPETKRGMGKYYDNCKDYYIYLHGNDTSESNV